MLTVKIIVLWERWVWAYVKTISRHIIDRSENDIKCISIENVTVG